MLTRVHRGHGSFVFACLALLAGGVAQGSERYPTTGADIVSAINDAAPGDAIYLPAGTFDCGAATLSPKAGVRVVGQGKDVTVLKANLLADLDGAAETLRFDGWTLDMAGKNLLTYGACEVHEGSFHATNWRATNSQTGNGFTAVSRDHNAYNVLLENCEIDHARDDCVSTKGTGSGIVLSSRLRIVGGHLHHCGDGPTDEMLTGHNGLLVEAEGTLIDNPGAGGLAVVSDELTGAKLKNCTIEGRLWNVSDVEGCDIDAAGFAYDIVEFWDDGDVRFVNNKVHNVANSIRTVGIRARGWIGKTQVISGNVIEGSGQGVGLSCENAWGDVQIYNNWIGGFAAAADVRHQAVGAVLLQNNVLLAEGGCAIISDDDANVDENFNLLQGECFDHTPGVHTLLSLPDVDGNGWPVVGGNCWYGNGNPNLRPGLGWLDIEGYRKHYPDQDVIGPYNIPEPATLTLLAVGSLAMLRRRS